MTLSLTTLNQRLLTVEHDIQDFADFVENVQENDNIEDARVNAIRLRLTNLENNQMTFAQQADLNLLRVIVQTLTNKVNRMKRDLDIYINIISTFAPDSFNINDNPFGYEVAAQ
jgi:hypothetical protein